MDIAAMLAKLEHPIEFLHVGPLRPVTRAGSAMGDLERYLLKHRSATPRQISILLGKPQHAWLETVRNLQRKIAGHSPALDHRVAWTFQGNLIVANLQSWEETDSSQVVRFIIRPPHDVRTRHVRRGF